MTARTPVHRLHVATELHQFIETQVLPGTGVASAAFWKGFDAIVADLAPKNIALLAERDRLQTELDAWHKAHPGPIAGARGMQAYRKFLEKIGYLVPVPAQVKATTRNVDAELATQAGPVRLFPALRVSPQASTAEFDGRFPQGADYVIVPAVHEVKNAAKLDFIVQERLLLMIRAQEQVTALEKQQFESILRLSGLRGGLLVNFNVPVLRKGVHRVMLKRRES